LVLSRVAALASGITACSGAIDGSDMDSTDQPRPGGSGGSTGSSPDSPGGSTSTPGGSTSVTNPPKIATPSACTGKPSVGAAPLRRLTRDQYANAVREVLREAMGTNPAVDSLSEDELVGPFFSNTVAKPDEAMTQQYMDTAERVGRDIAVAAKLDALVAPLQCAARDEACAGKVIDRYTTRAYRRPLTADERGRYVTLYRAYAAQPNNGGFPGGVRGIVQTMLQSPNFLYHLEIPDAAGTAGAVVALNPYALASRLAFALWNSGPDDTLIAAARDGSLSDLTKLRTQVSRMLGDARAREGLAAFHLQWMGIEGKDSLEDVAKNTTVYKAFTPKLVSGMRAETVAFIDYVLRGGGDGKLTTLLGAPYSFVNATLAPVYGVTAPMMGDTPVKTDLDPKQRGGLFTQASFLSVHAQTDGSSPVKRGVILRRNVMCQDLPDPPPTVNNAPPSPSKTMTTRERYTMLHEKDPTCAGCHKLIDQVGFAYESYDGIGAWRSMENGKPIVSTVDLVSTDIDGQYAGALDLDAKLAQSPMVRQCMAKQWFRYALGRYDTMEDACTIQQITATLEAAQLDVRQLIGALAASDGFRYQKVLP
jgi:hypothetical protein